MKLRLELFPRALSDLDAIWEYTVHTWGLAQADRYIRALNERMQGLCELPQMGVAQDRLYPGLRRLGVGRHAIYYLVDDKRVMIARILHQRMDVAGVEFRGADKN